MFDAYVSTPRPPPLVWAPHTASDVGDTLELDVRRCRRSALTKSAHDFAIFSVLDSVRPSVAGFIADFTYVDLKRGKRSLQSLLPWVGPMFYHRSAVQHLLHYGICGWDDLTHSLQATAHLPSTALETPLRQMEEAWEGVDVDLPKQTVNSMIGLWAMDTQAVYHVKSSSSSLDGESAHMKRLVEYGASSLIFDFVYATKSI